MMQEKARKQNEKHCAGLAGEYLVAGQLCMRGWIANLTSKNCPAFDVFAYDPDKEKNINIQVKTIRGKPTNGFPISISRDLSSPNDEEKHIWKIWSKIQGPYVFVHIENENNVSYYILSRQQTIDVIIESDTIYFEGTNLKKPRTKELQTYPLALPIEYIKKYKDKWHNLWQ